MATHIAKLIAKMRRDGKAICEPSEKAEGDYCELIYNGSTANRAFYAQCTPGYYNNEGDVNLTTKTLTATYPIRAKYNGGVSLFGMMEKQQAEDSLLYGFDTA